MSMASAALSRRREQERILLERQSFLKDNVRADCAAKWEKRSSDRIEQRDILTRAKKLADRDDKELEEKRCQIRRLYESEMAEWKAMVLDLQSKLNEEREYHLREKAVKLKEKREQERLELANACYERQWRESSDEARTLVSQSMNDRLVSDRQKAFSLHDLNAKGFQDKRDKTEHVEMCIRLQEEREANERLHRQLQKSDIRLALDEQVNELKRKADIENKIKMEEETALLQKWRVDDECTRRQEKDGLTLARFNGTEMLRANVDRQIRVNQVKAIEEGRDKLLLEYSMEKEKREVENDKNRRQNQQDECKGYIITLNEHALKDQLELQLVEKSRMEAIEDIHKRRDLELNSQFDGRKQMMSEINKTRQEQIYEKERIIKEEKTALTKQSMETMAQLQRQTQCEEELRKKKQELTLQTMMCNKELAKMKEEQKLKERQRKYAHQVDLDITEQKQKDKLDRLANQLSSKRIR